MKPRWRATAAQSRVSYHCTESEGSRFTIEQHLHAVHLSLIQKSKTYDGCRRARDIAGKSITHEHVSTSSYVLCFAYSDEVNYRYTWSVNQALPQTRSDALSRVI